MNRPAFSFLIFALCCGLWSGCFGDGMDLIPVTGKVTLDGQPLDNAMVTFVPEQGRPSVGLTDQNGVYRLRYTSGRNGATPGIYSVMITSELAEGGDEATGVVIPGRPELVPERYRRDSELKMEVRKGQSSYDFDLQTP